MVHAMVQNTISLKYHQRKTGKTLLKRLCQCTRSRKYWIYAVPSGVKSVLCVQYILTFYCEAKGDFIFLILMKFPAKVLTPKITKTTGEVSAILDWEWDGTTNVDSGF